MQDYRKLKVWQAAHRLTLAVYDITSDFPSSERFGLGRQLRRAAVSVASNIVEGASRSTRKDFARFLDVARGSLAEVEYQVFLAGELGYIPTPISDELVASVDAVGGMLTNLIRSVRSGPVAKLD